jgi:hypothetical protein
MDFIPLQEREEWLSLLGGFRRHALLLPGVRHAAPNQLSIVAATGSIRPLPASAWDAEFCAIYFGNQSYSGETSAYREQIRRLFKDGQTYANWQDNPEEIICPQFPAG